MKQKPLSVAGLFAGAVFGVLISLTPAANAVTLDFVAEAAGDERGVADGTIINFDGLNVTFSATGGSAYFDDLWNGNPGGLGVCTNLTNSNQCNPGSDDNVSAGEAVTLGFADGPVDFSNLTFSNDSHFAVSASDTLLIGINGGALSVFTFSDAIASTFLGINDITFAFGGGSANNFYLNSATAVSAVPIPAALPLFGTGLAAMGFIGWRRKRKSAAAA